jgi:hypothetical protein
MEQDSFEAFLKALRTDQDRLREDMRPYESAGYLLLRRAPTGELQDVTDQYVAKIKRDIDSIDGAIEFVMAQQGPVAPPQYRLFLPPKCLKYLSSASEHPAGLVPCTRRADRPSAHSALIVLQSLAPAHCHAALPMRKPIRGQSTWFENQLRLGEGA